jgi:predicted Zn-dependent peptidase
VRQQVLAEANAIAQEWVTRERLTHVLDHAKAAGTPFTSKPDIPKLIAAMRDDIYREAKGEIVESKEAETAIGRLTATLFLERISS